MQGRGVLSCASCRQRKLRCDRQEPCSNCVTRSVDCCYTYPSAPRTRTARGGGGALLQRDGSQTKHLEARLRHLEQLLGNMASRKSSSSSQPSPNSVTDSSSAPSEPQQQPAQANDQVKPGKLLTNDGEVVYVSGSHWQAICNEVSSIKEHLDREDSESPMQILGSSQDGAPYLLEGTGSLPDVHEILGDIPPRDVADRLTARYFHSSDPYTVLFHAPTFQDEYTKFWSEPHATSLPWLAILFGLMCMGIREEQNEGLPSSFGGMDHGEVVDLFHRRCTDCLILSRYSTSPTTYTIEALLQNLTQEVFKNPDAHIGSWVLGGVVVRLALRMGYHRDPDHYPQFSPFQGEMRRRIWCAVLQLDIMGSSLMGLPSMIQEAQYDTRLPGNYLDEDFSPSSVQLPPQRPDTEVTPILYVKTKTALMCIFRTIFNQVSMGRVDAYEDIMRLDRRLHEVQSTMSPRFRITILEKSLVASPSLVSRGYALELLFQGSRCTLHRHHMTKAYRDPRFNFSRSASVDAAMEILRHQANIHREMQVGGILHRERWFLTMVPQQNFLVASMIVCLELSHRGRQAEEGLSSQGDDQGFLRYTRDNLVAALRSSQRFWADYCAASADARQAYSLLSVMLDKVGQEPVKKTDDQSRSSSMSTTFVGTEMCDALPSLETEFAPSSSDLGGFGMLLHTPEMLDWNSWEAFIQNPQGTTEV